MEIDKHLNLEIIIRYGFSGFTAIILLLILPYAILDLGTLLKSFTAGSLVGLFSISFVIGYLLDSLKLYNLTPKYLERKTIFLKKLSEILSIKEEDATVYFSILVRLSRHGQGISLEKKQAEWHLLENTAKIFLLAVLEWIIILSFKIYSNNTNEIILSSIMIIICILITIRLFKISNQERIKIDKLIFKYADVNKQIINKSMELKIENTAPNNGAC